MSKKNVEWEWKKLKDICEKGSSSIKQGDLKKITGDYPIYGASGFIQNVDFYQQDKEYIGIVKDGSGVGRTMFLPAYSSVIGTLQYILPKEGNSIKFVNYALQNIDFSKLIQGAAIPHIYFKDYGEMDIAVPPLDEQERIVKVLDDAFEKIDAIKTTAETNLQNAKELFQTTLANELSITDEKIKQGWEERTLENTCELMCGYAFDSKGYSIHSKDTLLICGDNIVNCDFRWDTEKRWPKEKCSELKRFELRLNDIVLAMDRPWVKSGLKIAKVSERELPSLLVQRTACLRAHQKLSQDFLYFCLQNAPFSSYLTGNQTGGGVPHISGKQILAYIIPLPPLPIQKQIVAKLDSLSEKVKQLESNYKQVLADCDELKKALLKQAFEGML